MGENDECDVGALQRDTCRYLPVDTLELYRPLHIHIRMFFETRLRVIELSSSPVPSAASHWPSAGNDCDMVDSSKSKNR